MYILFLLLSFSAWSFNDWRIECQGFDEDLNLYTVSDERINGDKKNRIVDITQWSSERRLMWSVEGRQYIENRNYRNGSFFKDGRRMSFVLSYLNGFTKLPSEENVDLRKPNSFLKLDFHAGIPSNSPVMKSSSIDMNCYYRKGGE